MSRLAGCFAAANREGRAALVIYLTAGDPSPDHTVAVVEAVVEAGADVIELGVPFSDPNADGVVIQAAMERARAAGGGLTSALDNVAELRRRGCAVPIVLFGYYNPIFVHGNQRFADAAAAAGVDAVLTVDLPIDEIEELRAPLASRHIEVVPLCAPTSTPDRVARIRALAPPFVYYISMTGVTGATFSQATVGSDRVAAVRIATGAPVAVGFGIKTAADAAAVAAYADGVVVGSAVVSRIAEASPDQAAAAAGAIVAELRAGIEEARRGGER